MANIPGKYVYQANDKSLHDTMEEAMHRNGILALQEELRKLYGERENVPINEIVKNFQNWYTTYMEARG